MKTLDNIQLPIRIRSAIQESCARLKAELPVNRVILFGSQARGQAQPDSDIDLLILTTCPVTREIKDRVGDILFEIDLKDDVVLTSITVHQERWEQPVVKILPLYQNIQKEGVQVA